MNGWRGGQWLHQKLGCSASIRGTWSATEVLECLARTITCTRSAGGVLRKDQEQPKRPPQCNDTMPPLSIRPVIQLNCPIVAMMVVSSSIGKYGANPLALIACEIRRYNNMPSFIPYCRHALCPLRQSPPMVDKFNPPSQVNHHRQILLHLAMPINCPSTGPLVPCIQMQLRHNEALTSHSPPTRQDVKIFHTNAA